MRPHATLFAAALGLAATATGGEELLTGLTQNQVDISATFDGSEIVIFGTVKRDAPPPEGRTGLIVTVAGPDGDLTVRRKDRVAGIWVNAQSAGIDRAPSFYAVNTTAALSEIVTETEDLRHKISIDRAIRAVGVAGEVEDPSRFIDGLIRLRTARGLYQMNAGAVRMQADTLFDTRVSLPANLTEGTYVAQIYLTRDRNIVALTEAEIEVSKVGLERFLYHLAYDQPLVYGFMSLAIATAAGWGASAAFRFFTR